MTFELRRQRLTGWQIARRLGMARSTVAAVLLLVGLSRLSLLEPPKPLPLRYERQRPGELVHLDVKPPGKIGVVGHRVHGDWRRRARGVGWEFVHVAIDDATRLAFVKILSDQKGLSAVEFFERARRWFARQRICRERLTYLFLSLFSRVSQSHAIGRNLHSRPPKVARRRGSADPTSTPPDLAKDSGLKRVDRREPTPCELLAGLLTLFLDQYVTLNTEALPAVDPHARGPFVNENLEANVQPDDSGSLHRVWIVRERRAAQVTCSSTLLRYGLPFFAVFFSLVALAQYIFVRSQLDRTISAELRRSANAIRREIAYKERWDLRILGSILAGAGRRRAARRSLERALELARWHRSAFAAGTSRGQSSTAPNGVIGTMTPASPEIRRFRNGVGVATRASLTPYFLRDKFGLEQEGHVKKPIIGRLIVCSLAIFAVDAFAAQHVACNVQSVQIVSGNHARVAIRCASETPIVWFAYRQSNNPTTAQMILHVATAAAVHNKTIDIYYDKDESGYAWGCLHSDCRVITWLEMRD